MIKHLFLQFDNATDTKCLIECDRMFKAVHFDIYHGLSIVIDKVQSEKLQLINGLINVYFR